MAKQSVVKKDLPGLVSVVGAGNWLIRQDNVGPRVLELIADRYGQEVELCDTGSTGLALLDHLHHQELLIVVDACTLGDEPGEIHELEPDYTASGAGALSAHQLGPNEALAIAKQLFPEKLPQRTLLVLVETEGLDEEALEDACRRIVSILDREIECWHQQRLSAIG